MKQFQTLGAAALCALLLVGVSPLSAQMKVSQKSLAERGKYLVNVAGCNHCHSPKVMGPMGPEPDTTQLLAGHPAASKPGDVPAGVLAPDKWFILTTGDLTAWAGPWGVSFAKNLTPDTATGLGSWTEAMFVKALRTGKDMGEGRPILPPMPWSDIGHLNDGDLKAIFAYLRSLKPIANAVPDPIPPAQK
jgi:mono/diheme cytochrome c family protein